MNLCAATSPALSSSQAPGPPRLQRMVINIRHAVLLKLTQPLRRHPNIFTQLNYFCMGSQKYFWQWVVPVNQLRLLHAFTRKYFQRQIFFCVRWNIFASELYLSTLSGGPIIMLNRRCEILPRQPIGGGRGVNWGHHQPMTGRLSIWGVLLLWRGTTEVQRLSVHTDVKCYLHKTVEFTLHCGEVKSELCVVSSH